MRPDRAFLLAAAARPFAWGTDDCCLFPADWVLRVSGRDPAATLRGRYSTQRGALRLIGQAGGLVAIMGEAMASAGLLGTKRPVPGDVAVVRIRGAAYGAVRASSGAWFVKGPTGLILEREGETLAAWAVP